MLLVIDKVFLKRVGVLCFFLTFAALDQRALQDRLAILLADLESRQQVKHVGDGAWTANG